MGKAKLLGENVRTSKFSGVYAFENQGPTIFFTVKRDLVIAVPDVGS